MRTLRPILRATRAAFTLVELLAVILIISILMIFLLPKIPEAMDQAQVTACKKNMTEIYSGFTIYQSKFQKSPSKSGVKFFAELISLGVWENTQASVKKLNCPGVDDPTGPGELPKEQWYESLEQIDGTWSTYAGRDCQNHPLRKLNTGKEPLVADDNDGGMNHRTTTVVLYGDGTPQTYELKLLEEQGVLPKDELLVVGPGSQVEDLRKLSLD